VRREPDARADRLAIPLDEAGVLERLGGNGQLVGRDALAEQEHAHECSRAARGAATDRERCGLRSRSQADGIGHALLVVSRCRERAPQARPVR
jgi:hypothetical protein